MLTLGMAFAVITELERAEIETYIDEIAEVDGIQCTVEAAKKTPITLDAKQLYRLVIRPSVVFRPTKNFSLIGLFHLKMGFKKEDERGLDHRTDTIIKGKVDFSKVADWGKKVSLVLEYRYLYDHVPPAIPESHELEENKTFRNRFAEPSHHIFSVKLNIEF